MDESGDEQMKHLQSDGQRYLALLSVWMERSVHDEVLQPALDEFRISIFGPTSKPLCLHREDILNRRGLFGLLRDEDLRDRFNSGLLRLLAETEFRMVCVVVDKQRLLDSGSPMHPYHQGLAVMLERYVRALNQFGTRGDLIAEMRGGREDRALESVYRALYEGGTRFNSAAKFQRALTSNSPKFAWKTDDVAGLQLADILAHPVKAWVLWKSGKGPEPVSFGRQMVEHLESRFHKAPHHGTVEGFGWKLL